MSRTGYLPLGDRRAAGSAPLARALVYLPPVRLLLNLIGSLGPAAAAR